MVKPQLSVRKFGNVQFVLALCHHLPENGPFFIGKSKKFQDILGKRCYMFYTTCQVCGQASSLQQHYGFP